MSASLVRRRNIYRRSTFQKSDNKNVYDNQDGFAILIEGQSLTFILESRSSKEKFLKILEKCQAVVVCRASPS